MLSVLYVDDEPDLLELGKLFLEESLEYTIDTSISAADALIRLEQKKYDAIISDYQMPVMDGIKFLQVLRNRGDPIPFIIFTGRGREEVIIEALNSGVDFYLQKGGDPKAQFAELKNIIGKAVRQKSADDALKESEAKYRNILENIQDVYYRSDVDGNLILASPSMATVLGYDSLSELYGKNISQTLYYNPEQRKQFLLDINRSGSVTNYDVTLKKRDGTPIFVLTSSHKYYDQSGNYLGVEGIFLDITERKKTEDKLRAAYEQLTAFDEEMQAQFDELKYGQDALRTSEKKLQGIVHGSPIPQFVIDKNHQVISWNRALEQYSGVKAEDVIGTNQQWKAFYPEERPCMADLLVDGTIDKIPDWYLGKYNKSKYVEGAYEATDYFPKMGTSGKWLYFTASTIRDLQGNVIGAVETLEDITGIILKEQALKASEEQYRNVVETQTEFICRFKPDGTHVFANEAYCRYFSKDCRELIGKKLQPEIHTDDRDRLKAHFSSFTREKPVSAIDHRIIMPDGSLRWQRWVDRAIFNEQGEITEYQTVGRDITDIKKAEEEILKMSRFQQGIIANANVWLMALDLHGTILLWNNAAEEISGYSANEVVGNNRIWSLIYPEKEYRKTITQTLLQIISKRKFLQNFETTILTKSGDKKIILWNTRGIDESKDRAVNFVAIGIDITKSILAERALRKSENKLSAIVRGSPIPQFVIDRDHKVIQWNEALEKYSGISVKEVLGTNQQWKAFYTKERPCMADLLVEGQIEKIPQWYSGKYTTSPLIKDAYEATDFFPHMGKSGTWLHFTAAPIRDFEGIIIGAVETLEDITERKKAEQALRDGENKLSAIVRGSPIPQFVIDRDHKVIQWNEALEKYSGISVKEVLGTNQQWKAFYTKERPCMADLLVEGQIEKIPQWYSGKYIKSTLIKDAYEATDFFPHMGKSGTWLHFTAAPIRDENGKILGAVETLEDITAMKDAEKELKKNEEKYRNILDNIQDIFYRSDSNGNLIMISPSGAALLGYDSPDDLIGLSIAGQVYAVPDDLKAFLDALKLKGSVKDYEVKLKRKDGTVFTVATNSHFYYNPDGSLEGIEGIFRDITDLKRTEELLRESEALYRAVFDNTGAATIIIAPDTTILLANNGWEKLTGVPKAEQEHKTSWTVFIDKEDVERMKQYHYSRRKDPTLVPRIYECRLIDVAGHTHNCIVNVLMIPGSSNSVASLVDISELKQAEEALLQINKKLNLMSSVTRHDILNQLTALSGYTELLKNHLTNDQDLIYISHSETAIKNIERQITFTKLYQDIGVNGPEWQRTANVIRLAVSQLSLGMITLKNDINDIEIYADPLLVKVFYNLIDNSLRYGDKITKIRFYSSEGPDGLVLFCSDDGVGIAENEKDRIFDRGFGRHSGFGLFLAREILSITGLTIKETGEPGKGARFEIHIPKGAYRHIHQ
jgi:PAS domain S-box-containing protein